MDDEDRTLQIFQPRGDSDAPSVYHKPGTQQNEQYNQLLYPPPGPAWNGGQVFPSYHQHGYSSQPQAYTPYWFQPNYVPMPPLPQPEVIKDYNQWVSVVPSQDHDSDFDSNCLPSMLLQIPQLQTRLIKEDYYNLSVILSLIWCIACAPYLLLCTLPALYYSKEVSLVPSIILWLLKLMYMYKHVNVIYTHILVC